MNFEIYLEIVFIAVLILLNAYLSMAEIAIVSSKKILLQKEEKNGNKWDQSRRGIPELSEHAIQ